MTEHDGRPPGHRLEPTSSSLCMPTRRITYALIATPILLVVLGGYVSNAVISAQYKKEIYARDILNIRTQFAEIFDPPHMTDEAIMKMTSYEQNLWIPYYFSYHYSFYPSYEPLGDERLWGEDGRIISFLGLYDIVIEQSSWIR